MWSSEDRAAARVWQEDQDDRCRSCGHGLSTTVGVEHEHDFDATEFICQACAVIDTRRWKHDGASPVPGRKVFAKEVTDA